MRYSSNELEEKISEDFGETTTKDYSAPATRSGIVTKKYVNVRRYPSKTGEVLGRLQLNNKVEIIDKDGDYYRIKYKNYPEAYIATQFVEEN